MKKGIVGIGVDLVHIPRIKIIHNKYGDKFLYKALHPTEIQKFHQRFASNPNSGHLYLASRFEIFSKQ